MTESNVNTENIESNQRKKTLARIFGGALVSKEARKMLLEGKLPEFIDNLHNSGLLEKIDPESNPVEGLTDEDKEIFKNSAENIQDLANSILNQ